MDFDSKLLWIVVAVVVVLVALFATDLLDNAGRIFVRILLRRFIRELF